jgi:sec-independent protein translocase protein TatB
MSTKKSCGFYAHCRVSFSGSMMKRMSFSETIFLFFLALLVFGPKKLPEIARQVGKMLNEFRRASNEFKSQIEQEIAHLEVEDRRKTMLPASPAPEGTASRTLSLVPAETAPDPAPASEAATLTVSSESADASILMPDAAQVSIVATEAIPAADSAAADRESQQNAQQESHV